MIDWSKEPEKSVMGWMGVLTNENGHLLSRMQTWHTALLDQAENKNRMTLADFKNIANFYEAAGRVMLKVEDEVQNREARIEIILEKLKNLEGRYVKVLADRREILAELGEEYVEDLDRSEASESKEWPFGPIDPVDPVGDTVLTKEVLDSAIEAMGMKPEK